MQTFLFWEHQLPSNLWWCLLILACRSFNVLLHSLSLVYLTTTSQYFPQSWSVYDILFPMVFSLDIMVHKICMVQLVFSISSEKWEISCSQLHASLNVYLTPVLMINNSSHCDLLLNSQNFCLFNDQITKITHVFSIWSMGPSS